jgi:hypothetical protein
MIISQPQVETPAHLKSLLSLQQLLSGNPALSLPDRSTLERVLVRAFLPKKLEFLTKFVWIDPVVNARSKKGVRPKPEGAPDVAMPDAPMVSEVAALGPGSSLLYLAALQQQMAQHPNTQPQQQAMLLQQLQANQLQQRCLAAGTDASNRNRRQELHYGEASDSREHHDNSGLEFVEITHKSI